MAKAITGLADIQRAIDKNERKIRGALAAALYEEGLDLDNKSVKMVPVDTGRLRSTHFVAPPTNKRTPHVEVGYGTNYAIYVHEGANGVAGRPYLRAAMEAAQAGYTGRLARRTWRNYQQNITSPILSADAPTAPKEGAGGKVRRKKNKKKGRR